MLKKSQQCSFAFQFDNYGNDKSFKLLALNILKSEIFNS